MHLHLPKPLHGWRAFVGEVGIIVVGVLIALGAEQVVENLRWKAEVADARNDLRAELAVNLFNAQERIRFESCLASRFDRLDALIDHPPPHPWKLLPAGRQLVPIRVWSSAGWDSAVAGGAVSHMAARERSRYAQLYSFVRGLHALVLEEFAISTEVRMLEHGGPLSEASQDRLRADVARLRGYNAILALGSKQLSTDLADAGIRANADDLKRLSRATCPLPGDSGVVRNGAG